MSSLESFLRNMFVKKELRLSLFFGSPFVFLGSSGLSVLRPRDDGEAAGLSLEGVDDCVGVCAVEVCEVGLRRWLSGVFVPSSSEPVSVEWEGEPGMPGMAEMGISDVAGVEGASGDVGAELSVSSTEPTLIPPKLLAVVKLKSSDLTRLSCISREFSERDVVKSREFDEARCESIECDVVKCRFPACNCGGGVRAGCIFCSFVRLSSGVEVVFVTGEWSTVVAGIVGSSEVVEVCVESDTTIGGTISASTGALVAGVGAREIPHMSAGTACRVALEVLAAYSIIDIYRMSLDFVYIQNVCGYIWSVEEGSKGDTDSATFTPAESSWAT